MYVIIYIAMYRTQSLSIVLFSYLLQTLAVLGLILSARIFTGAFPQWSHTCHITGYGPWHYLCAEIMLVEFERCVM